MSVIVSIISYNIGCVPHVHHHHVSYIADTCKDLDRHCSALVAQDGDKCLRSSFVVKNCLRTCVVCGDKCLKLHADKNLLLGFDIRYVPQALKPLAWLIGIWRAETGGKAIFPTIPVFTYGEQIEFALPNDGLKALKALNYSAFAWDMNNRDELHSEYGFMTMKASTREIALSTVMNNGMFSLKRSFVTIEQGPMFGTTMKLSLQDIGRISFSRDLPVHGTIREFRLLDSDTLEQRFMMETLTHRMQLHTFIKYKKIYPK
ncbi:unnamed protein product [Thelazia callipaeda]|uniref:ShKT domain-containing protein n=1 Tax=Thelazia callipaeda TaxID=103827 RepID=A0A0N5D839_THECL|nr:unnamed protein product [Thelazia callipaeda]